MAVKIRSFGSNVAALSVGILFDEEEKKWVGEVRKRIRQEERLQYFMTETRHAGKDDRREGEYYG